MTRSPERGFTLIEILMALAILTIGLTVLFSALSPATQASGVAEAERSALAGAQSLIAELGHARPISDGKFTGQFVSGQRWSMVIAPYPGDAPNSALAGHDVSLDVTWSQNGRPRDLVFKTTLLTVASQ